MYRILFLSSILLLLINDLYLKYEYHNYLTGKLSDFAGLFAFPYFFSCFYPKKIKPIYILSGLLFVFWKSEFSQPTFDIANSYGIEINRTIDYWDLIALLILPISYKYWKAEFKGNLRPKIIFKSIIVCVSCFAFVATSLPRHREEIPSKSKFQIDVSSEFNTVKNKLHIHEHNSPNPNYYLIKVSKKDAHITTSIKVDSINQTTTRILLDSIISFTVKENGFIFSSGIDEGTIEYIKKLSKSEIEQFFSEQIKKQFGEK